MKKHKIMQVLSKKIYKEKFVELLLENDLTPFPRAGQFLHILTGGAFIRRPLSIAGCTENSVRILFEIKGKGTKKLSEISKGQYLDIVGPVGNNFPLPDRKKEISLVAGGMGLAPLLFLASQLISEKMNFKFFYGARDKGHLLDFLLPKGDYKKFISTDDGSDGEKLTVVEMFERKLNNEKTDIVFAAGPYQMLKALSEICRNNNIEAYVSLENIMFCGLGVCQGCVTETINGYKRVCRDGPVFDHREIKWT